MRYKKFRKQSSDEDQLLLHEFFMGTLPPFYKKLFIKTWLITYYILNNFQITALKG